MKVRTIKNTGVNFSQWTFSDKLQDKLGKYMSGMESLVSSMAAEAVQIAFEDRDEYITYDMPYLYPEFDDDVHPLDVVVRIDLGDDVCEGIALTFNLCTVLDEMHLDSENAPKYKSFAAELRRLADVMDSHEYGAS